MPQPIGEILEILLEFPHVTILVSVEAQHKED